MAVFTFEARSKLDLTRLKTRLSSLQSLLHLRPFPSMIPPCTAKVSNLSLAMEVLLKVNTNDLQICP